jgi:carbonic anhydrase/acetyltransferase-like protein (isoleucine patch superfamily)
MLWKNDLPFRTNDTWIAPTASVIGDVTLWDETNIWFKAVLRADQHHQIRVGFKSSVGDGAVLTTLPKGTELETGFDPECFVGHYVTIGAGSVLKSCRIGDKVWIKERCTILEGAIVEDYVILEPGTVVMPYQRIPKGQKWGGNPAQYIADVYVDEKDAIMDQVDHNVELAWEHIKEYLDYGYSYVHYEQLEREAAQKEQSERAA